MLSISRMASFFMRGELRVIGRDRHRKRDFGAIVRAAATAAPLREQRGGKGERDAKQTGAGDASRRVTHRHEGVEGAKLRGAETRAPPIYFTVPTVRRNHHRFVGYRSARPAVAIQPAPLDSEDIDAVHDLLVSRSPWRRSHAAAISPSTNQPQVGSGSFAAAANVGAHAELRCFWVSRLGVGGRKRRPRPDAGAAYDNLVNARPTNLAAQRDGLKRVTPFKPDSSLLFQKIVLALAAHGSNYGNVMPVGSQALPQGQVDFIRKWIEAGAPATGDVADATLLTNKTPQSGSLFVPLAAPAAGQGVQIHVDSFGVKANFERELFVYRSLGNASDIYVNRIQTSMRALSHHFVLYSVDPSMAPGWPCTPAANVVRDIRNADGSMNLLNMIPMACHVFVGGSMTQTSDYVFPAGVALRSAGVDVDRHERALRQSDGGRDSGRRIRKLCTPSLSLKFRRSRTR